MTGKLSGHTATVMTLLLCERNDNTLLFTGSKDHYIKVLPRALANGSNILSVLSVV